jgi:hypothetical protein
MIRLVLGLAVALALSASCQTQATRKVVDLDLFRGCWIERRDDGVVVTLRLLPARDGGLGGHLQYYPSPQLGEYRWIAADGSQLVVGEGKTARTYLGNHKNPVVNGDIQELAFRESRGQTWTNWRVIASDGEQLRMYDRLNGWEVAVDQVIEFQRDGCD